MTRSVETICSSPDTRYNRKLISRGGMCPFCRKLNLVKITNDNVTCILRKCKHYSGLIESNMQFKKKDNHDKYN